VRALSPTTWQDLRGQFDPLKIENGDWIFDIDGEYWRIINVSERGDAALWMVFRFVGDRSTPFDFDDVDCCLDATFDGATAISVVRKILRFTRGNRVTFRQRHGAD
jgi:hypothetical protein